jgi:hypothetical protein
MWWYVFTYLRTFTNVYRVRRPWKWACRSPDFLFTLFEVSAMHRNITGNHFLKVFLLLSPQCLITLKWSKIRYILGNFVLETWNCHTETYQVPTLYSFWQESYFQSSFVFREHESAIEEYTSRLRPMFQRRYPFSWTRIALLKVRSLYIYIFVCVYYSIIWNDEWCDVMKWKGRGRKRT